MVLLIDFETQPLNPPNEIFCSHSGADHETLDKIVEALRRHGLPVWYSAKDVLGSQQWHDEIGLALDRCDWFIVVLSKSSVESMWVGRELKYALDQDRYLHRIVPILLEPCNHSRLSWVISGLQIIDFQQPFDHACRDLLRIWGIGYKPGN